MQFLIVELSGRTHVFADATESTTVGDVRAFMGPLLLLPPTATLPATDHSVDRHLDLDRIILIFQGKQLKDNTETLVSLGLTTENKPPFSFFSPVPVFRMHAVLKFKAPPGLLDGNPHPFVLNDVSIGGDSSPLPESNLHHLSKEKLSTHTNTVHTYEAFVKLTSMLPASELDRSQEREREEEPDQKVLAQLDAIEALQNKHDEQHVSVSSGDPTTDWGDDNTGDDKTHRNPPTVRIPWCVRKFVSTPSLRRACSQMNFSPFVIKDYSHPESTDYYSTPLFVKFEQIHNKCGLKQPKAGLLFMGDGQGCCYWYAVWKIQDAESSASTCNCPSSKQVEVDALCCSEDVSVYVVFGGQSFDTTANAYLTSRCFWRFLCDYASQSFPSLEACN